MGHIVSGLYFPIDPIVSINVRSTRVRVIPLSLRNPYLVPKACNTIAFRLMWNNECNENLDSVASHVMDRQFRVPTAQATDVYCLIKAGVVDMHGKDN
jgi:hypothetical protein